MIEWIERRAFLEGLKKPSFFRKVVRPVAYMRAKSDPERVHEMALEALNWYGDVVRQVSDDFIFPNLEIEISGRRVIPFGTAAGLDKNGEAIKPISHLFGFQVNGTVVLHRRDGNPRPRIAVDNNARDLYNAQGFPSKGLAYYLANVRSYREKGGRGVVIASVCGIPPEPDKLDVARKELAELIDWLNPYVDGFVWNPFSPNTAALKALRNPKEFERSAELFAEKAGKKIKMVKMGPYDELGRQEWLDLVGSWLDSGGNGIVAVNTYMLPKEQVPSKDWGYPSAGRSGRFLQDYRQRAIANARKSFPESVIWATGGIDSADQALDAFRAGANALKGYTPYTFHGFGLLIEMAKGLEKRINSLGYKTLLEFQKVARVN